MDRVAHDRRIYELATRFLLNLGVPGVTESLLAKYQNPSDEESSATKLPDLYERILESAQNANMKAAVIGKSIGGVSQLARVLFDFDPFAVLAHYASPLEVLDSIQTQLKPVGKVRTTSRSLWPKYCQTILSAGEFLAQFSSGDDFHEWVRFFDNDARARPALPMLLEREIDGFGFALACDFLKEIGYQNFGKPDVHLKDIFEELDLTPTRKDFDVFRAVVRIAGAVERTPYAVDKLFWLIGSGKFYNDPQIGKNGHIGRRKVEFVMFAKQRLEKAS